MQVARASRRSATISPARIREDPRLGLGAWRRQPEVLLTMKIIFIIIWLTMLRNRHPPEITDCPRTRLAQGDLAAVDACGCGMLQLHIGALTLRMASCALEELASTLNDAVVAHARH